MNELCAQGATILMVSSELLEIMAMSDRIIVMQGGRIRGELTRAEATQERIMAFATDSEGPTMAITEALTIVAGSCPKGLGR